MNLEMFPNFQSPGIQSSDTLQIKLITPDTLEIPVVVDSTFTSDTSEFVDSILTPRAFIFPKEKISESREVKVLKKISASQNIKTSELLFNPDTIPYIISDNNVFRKNFLEGIRHIQTSNNQDFNQNYIIPFTADTANKNQSIIQQINPLKAIPREQLLNPINDWLLGLILVSFIILTWSKILFGKYFIPLINSVFNYQLAYKLYRDKSISLQRTSINLNFIYVFNLSLFLFVLFDKYEISIVSIRIFDFLICMVFIYFLIITKYILFHFVGFILLMTNEFSEYFYHTALLNKVLGIFLFPLILGSVYVVDIIAPVFIYLGIGLIIFFYFLRLLKGLKIFMRKDISIFYMFLYLCALEIFPLMVLYKYISFYLREGF